jgi:hypothetical protein
VHNPPALIDRLACFPRVLQALAAGLPDADLRWKPAPQHWSILEILCHLADEEERDFRPRLANTLAARPWEPIDPEGWADRYNEQSPAEIVARLATERERSVAWLQSLQETDWDTPHAHPILGPIRAGDLLASWAAHDALHLRQIARRLHELAQRDGLPYGSAYAGSW